MLRFMYFIFDIILGWLVLNHQPAPLINEGQIVFFFLQRPSFHQSLGQPATGESWTCFCASDQHFRELAVLTLSGFFQV